MPGSCLRFRSHPQELSLPRHNELNPGRQLDPQSTGWRRRQMGQKLQGRRSSEGDDSKAEIKGRGYGTLSKESLKKADEMVVLAT